MKTQSLLSQPYKMPSQLFPILVVCFLLMTGCAAPLSNGVVTVQDVWARPAANGDNSAVYFVIDNPFVENETLLSASSDLASATELHMTMMIEPESSGGEDQEAMPGMEDRIMRMMPQENVPIPANTSVAFEPGRFTRHVDRGATGSK